MRDNYKLKLLSKKLHSGKCQIKFVVSSDCEERLYGYLLTESGTTLKDVVNRIEERVKERIDKDIYNHRHLYNLADRRSNKDSILIFEN